jgi:hypothetical protein
MRTTLLCPKHVVLAALALGICADQLFFHRWLGISAPLFVALGLAALAVLSRREGQTPTRANLWLAGAALFFALCLALRAAPLLVGLNLSATVALLLLLAAYYQGEPLARVPGGNVAIRMLAALGEVAMQPAPLVAQEARSIRIDPEQKRRLIPVGRGLILALPVVGCFTRLLMSADSVFASYVTDIATLDLPFDLPTLFGHLTLSLGVAWFSAGGLLVALGQAPAVGASELPSEGATQPLELPKQLPTLGSVEALTVLASVDALFGGFMLVQGAYFFGGMDTLDRSGMTYAEYARRGFFELLAVACLTLALLWALALLTRRELRWQRRAFNSASAAMIVLVLGLLASAFQRMLLYEWAYGYTQLRLYTHSFMIWLALVLLLFLVALLRDRPRIFTFGSFVTALAYLAALNLANPDALIVRENIARYQTSGHLDAHYLTLLSADATPDLVAGLSALDSQARQPIVATLEWQLNSLARAEEQHGWPAWHLGRARARAAIESLGTP